MPRGDIDWFEQSDILSYAEIVRLAKIFAGLGIEKIRVTGGEPTLRNDIEKLISNLSKIFGIKSISMTTNGLLLQNRVEGLKEAGLASINVSLDTFRPAKFKALTGVDGVHTVLNSIKAARGAGLEVKINTVIIRGWNDDEIVDFAKFAIDTGHTVRFIEFMPLDGTGIWAPDLVFSMREMIGRISTDLGLISPIENPSSEPARLYSLGGRGLVGFIPSMTEPFCKYCDRVRINSDGHLLTCLFENPGYDIKQLLQNGKSDDQIREFILDCMTKKPAGLIDIIRTKSLRPTMNLMHRIGG